jgi:hypothetical protein
MGTVRTHRRRRQRHARRAARLAREAETRRFSRLSPLEMVAEARRTTPSGRPAYLRDVMEIAMARLQPSVIDELFRAPSLLDALRTRTSWRPPR